MLESRPSGTLRLLAASSARKGRWVRHHQTDDTLPEKNGSKNGVKNEPKNGISRKTASRALFREFSFFLSFLTSFWLCFSGKNEMKNKTKNSQKNATVNYPNHSTNWEIVIFLTSQSRTSFSLRKLPKPHARGSCRYDLVCTPWNKIRYVGLEGLLKISRHLFQCNLGLGEARR